MSVPVPSEKGQEALVGAICEAWLANADEIYPNDAAEPDPGALARVAASAAWAFFFNVLDAARTRDAPE